MGSTPEGIYGLLYFVKCKMTLNGGINVLVHFYINTLSVLYSLRLPGGGL